MPRVSMPRWTRMAGEEHSARRPLRLLLALLALFALPACTALRAPDELPEDPAASLQQLHWLAGDWRRLDAPAPSGERWWHDGPLLRGEAWVQDGKRRLLTERLTIEVDGERLVYRVEFPDPDAPDGVRSRTEFTLAHHLRGRPRRHGGQPLLRRGRATALPGRALALRPRLPLSAAAPESEPHAGTRGPLAP
jgi:hypothetical protein